MSSNSDGVVSRASARGSESGRRLSHARGRQTDAAPVAGLLDSSDPGCRASDVAAVAPHTDAARPHTARPRPSASGSSRRGRGADWRTRLAALLALAAPPRAMQTASTRRSRRTTASNGKRTGRSPRYARPRSDSLATARWLAADPSRSSSDDDVAFSGIVDDLTRAARTLLSSLNAHFADDGIAFRRTRTRRDLRAACQRARLTTHPPAAIPDQPLRIRLPDGPDAAAWRR